MWVNMSVNVTSNFTAGSRLIFFATTSRISDSQDTENFPTFRILDATAGHGYKNTKLINTEAQK